MTVGSGTQLVDIRDRRPADDRPGVVLLRNSTPKQVDNPRSVKAEEIARTLLEQRGIRVGAVLNEQGTSGKDLSRRPIAKQLVDELEAGKWAALSVIETSRTSRDPDGVDQRIFKRACRRGHALLLTEKKAYDFRNDADDLEYEVEAVFNSREWRILRRRTWQGSIELARMAPIHYAQAPFGYRITTCPVAIRGSVRQVRVLERDPDQEPLMIAIGDALDTEDGLQAAAWRLNATGHFQPNGKPWYWSQVGLALNRPIYVGRWEYGKYREADDLWDELDGPITHDVPELAWYDEERMARWKRKFAGKGKIRVRPEGRPHPVLGVLVCRHCRRPMNAQGIRGYTCGARQQTGECLGQNLSNAQADGAVRRLLGEVLPNLADLTSQVRAVLSSDTRPDLAADVRALDRDISARWELQVEAKIRGEETPADFWEKLGALQAQRAEKAARLADSDRAEMERRRQLAQLAEFSDPETVLKLYDEEMTAGEQQELLRHLFRWVVVGTNGARGAQARSWVVDYEPMFPNSVSEEAPWTLWLNRFEGAIAS